MISGNKVLGWFIFERRFRSQLFRGRDLFPHLLDETLRLSGIGRGPDCSRKRVLPGVQRENLADPFGFMNFCRQKRHRNRERERQGRGKGKAVDHKNPGYRHNCEDIRSHRNPALHE